MVHSLPCISHLRWPKRPYSSSVLENENQVAIRHRLWTNLSVKRARLTMHCQVSLQTTRDQMWSTRLLSTQQPANSERSPSPCACSPAGQVAGGLSVLDGSSLTEAQPPIGGHPSILASTGLLVGPDQIDNWNDATTSRLLSHGILVWNGSLGVHNDVIDFAWQRKYVTACISPFFQVHFESLCRFSRGHNNQQELDQTLIFTTMLCTLL